MPSTTDPTSADSHIPPPSHDLSDDSPEPFPTLNASESINQPNIETHDQNRDRATSNTSTIQSRLRSASKNFQESSPPAGFMIATSQIASSAPSLTDIRRGTYNTEGWSGEGQIREKERRASLSRRGSSQTSVDLARQRTSSNPSSPRQHQSNLERRHGSVPEVKEEGDTRHLDAFNSGIPLGSSEAPKYSMDKSKADFEMEHVADRKASPEARSSNGTGVNPITMGKEDPRYKTDPFDNGYEFPPKQKWTEATKVGLIASWKFFITPIGFLVIVYGLNIVAWGGMLFLLLCNASPAMCKPTCNDINSPRRVWIEIDSQILNALFCVTGFGTIPWRFRDLYYLLQYRIQKKEIGLRRLAGINRGWFRLAGSQELPVELGPGDIETGHANVPESAIPLPITKIADAPLTGIRAPPTKLWKLDFVIWCMVWNTFLQAVLSGFMWGLNRYDRPSWSTGLFVALACIVAAVGGIMVFIEGKHVKAIEGVPVTEKEKEILKRDRELGITHFNNINDKEPKEKKEKKKSGVFRRKEAVKVDEGAIEESVHQVGR